MGDSLSPVSPSASPSWRTVVAQPSRSVSGDPPRRYLGIRGVLVNDRICDHRAICTAPPEGTPAMRSAPMLSVVIPMYNEEAVLPLLVQRLRPVLDGIGETYEVVAVDDGSADDTPSVLTLLRRTW